ncbi:hypothetical protein A3J89_00695 [Candidatus Curtissbacteria bacterium RIFOXYB12_FULL_40_6]|nr:MAG: hypothetical protein A3J89_00695 [Candidatus Curtissbacteria bacterium RIFOXYB12_FULL_40_6]
MQLADKNLRDIPMSSSIDEFARKYNAYKQEHARLMAFINRTPSEQLTDKTEKDQQICKEAGIYMEVAEKLKNDKYYKLAAERAKGASCEGEINRELNEKKNKGVIDIKGKSASEVKDILLEKITAKLNRYFGKRLSYNKVAADLSMSVTITKKGELKVARVQVNSNGFECRDQKDRPVSDKAFEELVSGHLNEPEALKFPPFFRPRVFRVAVKISLSK